MNNIPVYMATGGTASLVLKEIPHRGIAYVLLRTITDLRDLAEECTEFCRSCGAEQVFLSQGPEPLEGFPHAYDMLLLHVDRRILPPDPKLVTLVPMTPENDAIYQRTYNRCFSEVSGAATYDRSAIQRIYWEQQQAYLATDSNNTVIGMGEVHGDELAAVGILPEFRGKGWSKALTLALLHRCPGQDLCLTAASDNAPALGLYGSLGFRVREKVSMWYLSPCNS